MLTGLCRVVTTTMLCAVQVTWIAMIVSILFFGKHYPHHAGIPSSFLHVLYHWCVMNALLQCMDVEEHAF